ncbi:DUF192 domain-containing protein [Oceanirhabdus sp. W0125-5]|uniref:DUF192 domain-containing protein n=1 Tax=Oceanirhabdus sp. W0125-5 TaxID=2999116 RepID=UPI0022F336BF|nr:DUF192 domain-containing protein [Oceanirhabdus sp. W0125-5]WBW95548.1 DUF192 domain-containing protein [Oceanirhabdus sp. W0125-5]
MKNTTNNTVLAENLIEANSFFKRFKGLMFTKNLPPQSALYIKPCKGIHTYFMNYNIDVLYLDNNNKILSIDENMEPRKVGKFRKKAVTVIELSSGRIRETKTQIGQVVEIIKEGGV